MFQKGPGDGFGAWGKIEVLKRFPNAVCKRARFGGFAPFYRVLAGPYSSESLAAMPLARDAWCAAAERLMNAEDQV